MKGEAEIMTKIEELQQNLSLITGRTAEEIKKPLKDRDKRLLQFLHMEKKVWECALIQMKWLFDNE